MFAEYYPEIIATAITLALYIPFRKLVGYIIRSFSTKEQRKDSRVVLIIRLFNTLLSVIFLIVILTIWGVKAENFMLTLTSVFTVIGVAMFAQWSLLSNITAGILLFFSFPFRIGDTIRIQDKDFPIEAKIIDIKAFCTILMTADNEKISYPNSLLLQKGIVIVEKKEDIDNPTI
ncbi:mechanosensitive ion channel [Myroides marinus]|uniref:Mechanosensitive ion channel n=1 Tax=Myroides marinus TaxID=703342 RepID=A0A165RGM9_9FLAO|nr:mechanosensitive ion channel domain-containing protein [Myroides marinus]KUF38272.1 mechanosensitive ion channel protein MscS [Myroides marinus]KZE81872.1 mechanosensitive ion channel protein MscS [Myroides marinus]MDM1347949.1 mechanosensitive ion channel [Myroides marinus]MDM1351521.1 mechanosensitive ion channel [Myroides marinus]MDM1354920.1 mechanosensitive ion channel [Myroides marinus]